MFSVSQSALPFPAAPIFLLLLALLGLLLPLLAGVPAVVPPLLLAPVLSSAVFRGCHVLNKII